MSDSATVEEALVRTCLALAREVYHSPVRLNIGQVDGLWVIEAVKDAESMTEKKGSWPRNEEHLLVERAPDLVQALEHLRDALSKASQLG